MIRRILTVLHRYVGLATALFLVIVGLTGAALAWYEPLSAWLSPELYHAPGHGAVLSPQALLLKAQQAEPRGLVGDLLPLDLQAGRGVAFDVEGKIDPASGQAAKLGYDALWLDPVSGEVLGRVDGAAFPPTRHNLMGFIYQLHYQLAIPGRWGTWILGIVALLWFFDCFIGAVLTFPRGRPFLAKWKPAWSVKPRRLNYDLHRAGGLWPWVLLAALALSGVYLNLSREVFMPVFGLVAKTTPDAFDIRPQRAEQDRLPVQVSAEQAVAIALREAQARQWLDQPYNVLHRSANGFWQIYFHKPPSQWATAGFRVISVDDQTGAVIHIRQPGGTAGDVILQWLVALHVGSVFGTPYKILLCVTGVAIAMLSVTGIVIWWRKRRGRGAQAAA